MGDREPLRVAVVEPVGGHGGIEFYDFGLCAALAGAGASATLYTCDATEPPPQASFKVAFPYRGIFGSAPPWVRGLRYLAGGARTALAARRERATIAHLHLFQTGALQLYDALLAKLAGLKVVVTVHDVEALSDRRPRIDFGRAIHRIAGRLIVHNQASASELARLFPATRDKIEVIPAGDFSAVARTLPLRAVARERLGVSPDARVLLFFGRVKQAKGLDLLLRAMPEVLRRFPDAVLVVAGRAEGDEERAYRDLVGELGIAQSCVVRFGFVPAAEVPLLLAAAELMVLPYRRIYQSAVLLLAMSYSLPVVAADLPAMREVVVDRANGLLFPAGDAHALAAAIGAALESQAWSAQLGREGRRTLDERHGWPRIAALTLDCYRRA